MKGIQVGLGQFGMGWLKDILLHHQDIQVIGVVDKNQELLQDVKSLQGMEETRLFNDVSEALYQLKPDFILNLTPPFIHKEINLQAFAKHIPVLSEKPIAGTIDDATQILDLSIKNNVPIMIAENYRFYQIARTAKKLLQDGVIGEIDRINVDFSRKHRMFNYHKDLEHPLLLDVTIHHLDMIRYLTGVEAKEIHARSWAPNFSWYSDHSTLDLWLKLEKDIKVSYRGSLSSFKNETDWLGDWHIEGEKGLLRISKGKISLSTHVMNTEMEIIEDQDTRKLVLDEFLRALKNGVPGETDIRDDIKTFKIVSVAIESIYTSKIVEI
jgi:predicted dehydrogenase